MILFRNCQDAALSGCDLSHAAVASGIKPPSTVLLYLEVRDLNSLGIAMFNNLSSARDQLHREATLAGISDLFSAENATKKRVAPTED